MGRFHKQKLQKQLSTCSTTPFLNSPRKSTTSPNQDDDLRVDVPPNPKPKPTPVIPDYDFDEVMADIGFGGKPKPPRMDVEAGKPVKPMTEKQIKKQMRKLKEKKEQEEREKIPWDGYHYCVICENPFLMTFGFLFGLGILATIIATFSS